MRHTILVLVNTPVDEPPKPPESHQAAEAAVKNLQKLRVQKAKLEAEKKADDE